MVLLNALFPIACCWCTEMQSISAYLSRVLQPCSSVLAAFLWNPSDFLRNHVVREQGQVRFFSADLDVPSPWPRGAQPALLPGVTSAAGSSRTPRVKLGAFPSVSSSLRIFIRIFHFVKCFSCIYFTSPGFSCLIYKRCELHWVTFQMLSQPCTPGINPRVMIFVFFIYL